LTRFLEREPVPVSLENAFARLLRASAAATSRPSSTCFAQLLRGSPMRPEIETLVEEIKQSVGLLRRHL
jgi:hypothetical protein